MVDGSGALGRDIGMSWGGVGKVIGVVTTAMEGRIDRQRRTAIWTRNDRVLEDGGELRGCLAS